MANNHSKPTTATTAQAPEAIDLDSLHSLVRKNRKWLRRLHQEQDRRRVDGIDWETEEDFDDSTPIHLTNSQLDRMARDLEAAIDFLEGKLKKIEDAKDKLKSFFKKKDDDEGDGGAGGGVFGSGYDFILTPINL